MMAYTCSSRVHSSVAECVVHYPSPICTACGAVALATLPRQLLRMLIPCVRAGAAAPHNMTRRAGSTVLGSDRWLDRVCQCWMATRACFESPAELREWVALHGRCVEDLWNYLLVQLHCQTVEAAAADVSTERDIDCAEFFQGDEPDGGAIVRAARIAGFRSVGYDIKRQPGVTDQPGPGSEDITTREGVLNALLLLQRVRVGGLVTFAPMCNSYNWLCRKQSGRSVQNGYSGNEAKGFVATGNRAAEASSFLVAVACLCGLAFVVENPPRSLLWEYLGRRGSTPGWHSTAVCDRCAFSKPGSALARQGSSEIAKQYRFVGNMSWVADLGLRCRCEPGSKHVKLTKTVGSKRWGRSEVLKASAAYPGDLGTAVVRVRCGLPQWSPVAPPFPCSPVACFAARANRSSAARGARAALRAGPDRLAGSSASRSVASSQASKPRRRLSQAGVSASPTAASPPTSGPPRRRSRTPPLFAESSHSSPALLSDDEGADVEVER